MDVLRLNNPRLGIEILPDVGGGLSRFTWHGREEPVALMRTGDLTVTVPGGGLDPNQLACYPLVPWSNRIAEGGFVVNGRRIALSANRHDEPFPIHGSGWQRAWQPQRLGEHDVLLSLNDTMPDGWSYRANLRYTLRDDALHIGLEVTNTSAATMPFGLGLHPFFPRHGKVALHAPASKVWVNNGQSPLPECLVDVLPAWDFRESQPVPGDGVNHGFCSWTGDATIAWTDLGLRLHVETDVDAFVMYTPASDNFFCFEPVDHAINAVHLPGGPVANGMTMLAPGASLARRFVFRVTDDTLAPGTSPNQDSPA
ncbi:aldose 1-epimerase [Pinirhizobacter sp.]|jgi:aldose 1-epimerase|uniref:aldose 1-epimerase n=1 Tax=Pinirhizobacter sp. TaxID=2950432 RepID=UPI002F3E5301